MATVLITSEFFGKFSDEGIKVLTDAGLMVKDPFGHKFLSPEDILPHCADADAFICDLEKITPEVVDASPNLKIVSRRGVGTDSVCVDYCTGKGIEVARTMGVVEAPVAELVMSYILEFSRRVSEMSADMHAGIWEKKHSHSVDGKTIGIIGMGHIGYETARRAHAFGMNVVYSDMVANEAANNDFGAKRMTFEQVLASSDFVSLHVPLTDSTKNLINSASLAKMKRSAYIINTSRGGVIDEQALCEALKNGVIAGAAVDVFEKEPETESKLRGLDNVLLTPHIGTFTEEIFIKMDVVAAQNVVKKLAQK